MHTALAFHFSAFVVMNMVGTFFRALSSPLEVHLEAERCSFDLVAPSWVFT